MYVYVSVSTRQCGVEAGERSREVWGRGRGEGVQLCREREEVVLWGRREGAVGGALHKNQGEESERQMSLGNYEDDCDIYTCSCI